MNSYFFLSEIGDSIGMKEDHQMILAMKLTWVIIDTITIMIILIIIFKNEISMNTLKRNFNLMFNLSNEEWAGNCQNSTLFMIKIK